jgi:hypothetical protein|tara:strand:+ start:2490 stop:3083 length:594 start_codon:yes stop_codon:yes gene_type:complete
MKNLKINLSIISFLLFISFANADHLIDLRILSSNNYSFIIQLSDIKHNTKCLLLDQQGVILYKEDIASAEIFQRTLNLMELPDGTYKLQIEDDYKTQTTSLTKSNGKVAAANQIKTTVFKPQITLKDTQLNVSLLALNNEKLTISIIDEDQNIISEKKLSGSINLGQSYDLSQLNSGQYTIQLYTNGKVYQRLITLN